MENPDDRVSYFYQGLYNYPFFEQQAFSDNFIWKSRGFQFKTEHRYGVEHSGADYLYAYWLARYAQAFPEDIK